MTEKSKKSANNGTAAKKEKKSNASDFPYFQGFEAFANQWQKAFAGSDDVTAFCKENLEAWVESAKISSERAEKIAAETVAFQQRTLEDGASLATKALSAQSFQEVVEMQNEYTKSVVDGYMSQMSRMGELWTESFQAATQPLNNRFSAFLQFAQGSRL